VEVTLKETARLLRNKKWRLRPRLVANDGRDSAAVVVGFDSQGRSRTHPLKGRNRLCLGGHRNTDVTTNWNAGPYEPVLLGVGGRDLKFTNYLCAGCSGVDEVSAKSVLTYLPRRIEHSQGTEYPLGLSDGRAVNKCFGRHATTDPHRECQRQLGMYAVDAKWTRQSDSPEGQVRCEAAIEQRREAEYSLGP
jgi:hypothetical protein